MKQQKFVSIFGCSLLVSVSARASVSRIVVECWQDCNWLIAITLYLESRLFVDLEVVNVMVHYSWYFVLQFMESVCLDRVLVGLLFGLLLLLVI